MATYSNDLRLKEIATGDESGTWGTSTNTNLSLIADAFGAGTKQMAANADETFTIPDGTADPTRALYLKITSAVSLTATRTVTLAPNTVSKFWVIENATSGAQSITIAQGSGATVTIPNGQKVMIYTDGAGATAAVFNANPSTAAGGTVTSVGGTGTVNGITLSGTVTSSGTLTLGGTLSGVSLTTQVAGTLPIASGGTGATDAAGARTALGATTVGANIFTLANPGAVRFIQLNADNTVSSLDATAFRTAIGAGTSSTTGTVTSVSGTGTVNGLTLSGTVTTSGNLTLGGTLSGVDLTTQVTGILPAGNGGTGNAFFAVSGPASSVKTYTLPNASTTILTTNAAVTVAQGGTGLTTLTANNVMLGNGTSTPQFVAPGASGNVLTSNGTTWVSQAPSSGVSDDHVVVTTGNGYGSTNTRIRRFTTTLSSAGSALTYADSATLGGSITVNEAGLYEIYVQDGGDPPTEWTLYGFGASVNSNQLSTAVNSITAANRVLFITVLASPGQRSANGASRVVRLAVNDVIRLHGGEPNLPNSTNAAETMLAVRKVGNV